MLTHSVEIARSPEDVFTYLDQLDRHGEWQTQILEVTNISDGPVGVGTRATEKRKVPGGSREMTYEITEHDSPRRVSFRGLDGPVRPVGTVTVEPLDDGARSKVTLQFTLEGHGIGKLIAPLGNFDARRQIPKDQQRLKERLEAGA
jgi:uncharacterized membrane protein